MMWSKWKRHTQGNMPVRSSDTVIIKMDDGDVIGPLKAIDIDWDCPEDPVIKFKVRASKAIDLLKSIASLKTQPA